MIVLSEYYVTWDGVQITQLEEYWQQSQKYFLQFTATRIYLTIEQYPFLCEKKYPPIEEISARFNRTYVISKCLFLVNIVLPEKSSR